MLYMQTVFEIQMHDLLWGRDSPRAYEINNGIKHIRLNRDVSDRCQACSQKSINEQLHWLSVVRMKRLPNLQRIDMYGPLAETTISKPDTVFEIVACLFVEDGKRVKTYEFE